MKYTIPQGATEVDINPIFTVVNTPTNKPPTVGAGNDIQIQLPLNEITLMGSGSDTDGNIVSWLWEKISGGSVIIEKPASTNTKVAGLTEGNYTFKLTVTDDKGATTSDNVNATVKPAVVTPPAVGTIQGYGAAVTGGNSTGAVVMCNQLTESALKAAIGNGNRVVKFGVSGTIKARLEFSSLKNVTIDGEGKVTIDNGNNGDAFAFEGSGCSNIIVRRLRVRNAGNDCLAIRCKNVVVEYCSFDKSGDGLLDLTDNAENITIQYNIFGTSVSGAMLLAYAGTRNISVHHNIFTAWDRDPLIHRANNYEPTNTEDLMCEFANNVVYGYTNVGSWVDYGGTCQFKNNYYQKKDGAIVANRDSSGAKVFSSGNIAKGGVTVGVNNHAEWNIPAQYRVTLLPALEAAKKVIAEAGCYPLDATDKAILAKISL